jgi:hypothetical protein
MSPRPRLVRTQPPITTEATDWAASLEQHLLHCRELGHSWDNYTAAYDAKSRSYHRTLMCASCHTQRTQVLDSTGEVIRNSYSYVEGYLAKGHFDYAGHKVPRSTFRLVALRRATGK